MFKVALSALALLGLGPLLLAAHAGGDRPDAVAAVHVQAGIAEGSAKHAHAGPVWGSPPLDPAANMATALADFGPIRAPEGVLRPERHLAMPIESTDRAGVRPSTYTTHPAPAPRAIPIIPVHMGEGFSPGQRSEIIEVLKEWNQVLNGYGRLRIVDDSATAAGTWRLQAINGTPPSAGSRQSLETLAFTQPLRGGGGSILVYIDRIGALDLAKVMRHEFGHVLGLAHDPNGGVMAARYADIGEQCIGPRAAAALAAAWRIASGDVNWCGQ